jgi:hypothetical protein
VSPLERSRPPFGQRDSMSGNKIRSRAAPQNRWSPVCRNKNATSRGKRQDPWRRANDPAQAGCRPCGRRSHRGNRFRNRDVTRFGGPHARKHAVWPGPEASPGMPHRGVTTAVAGFATEPERSAWSVPDRRSVGELAAKRHSTGEAERQMPVTGRTRTKTSEGPAASQEASRFFGSLTLRSRGNRPGNGDFSETAGEEGRRAAAHEPREGRGGGPGKRRPEAGRGESPREEKAQEGRHGARGRDPHAGCQPPEGRNPCSEAPVAKAPGAVRRRGGALHGRAPPASRRGGPRGGGSANRRRGGGRREASRSPAGHALEGGTPRARPVETPGRSRREQGVEAGRNGGGAT